MNWKKVSEELPHEGVPVLGYSPDWVDPDFNPDGVRECWYGDDGWVSAHWLADQDDYKAVGKEWFTCQSCIESGLGKDCKVNSDPEYWMERPKFNIKK